MIESEAWLALIELWSRPRCMVIAECPPEPTDAAQAPATPRLPIRAAVEVTVSSTGDTGATVALQGVAAASDAGNVNVRSAG